MEFHFHHHILLFLQPVHLHILPNTKNCLIPNLVYYIHNNFLKDIWCMVINKYTYNWSIHQNLCHSHHHIIHYQLLLHLHKHLHIFLMVWDSNLFLLHIKYNILFNKIDIDFNRNIDIRNIHLQLTNFHHHTIHHLKLFHHHK